MQGSQKGTFKLEMSTLAGQSADKTTNRGPQIQTLNSVVDHRSVFVQLSIFNTVIEAVCDSGASVSCLSSDAFGKLKNGKKLELKPSDTKLVAANKQPIVTRGIVQLPLQIGPRHYEHSFHVLEQAEADCLLGLDFLKTHKCDPLFSQDILRLDEKTTVPLYHRQLTDAKTTVFRVVVSETVSVPPRHTMIVPAHIKDWKRPLNEGVAIFEPHERFDGSKEAVAPSILFNFAEENIPVTIENSGEEPLILYEKTTLGTSEAIPDLPIQNVVTETKSLKSKIDEKDESYDLKNVVDGVDPEIPFKIKQKFAELVYEFEDVFSQNQWDIGRCEATTHKINVYPGSKPIKIPNRRMPLHYKQDLQEKLDAFLDKKLIAPCHSPYSAPAMLVPKKNGKLRLVIDYRQLNSQTIKSCWPIPSIEEIFDTLDGSSVFSTIDMSWGFYQLPLDESSQDYTAFSTPFGSFKWLVMPMGLTNSPPTFQNLMEIVLAKLIWKTTVPYLDDCIIFAASPEEHLERVREVLGRFRQANLKINPLKCEFFRTKVHFLGHVISKEGLQVDPTKIAAVKEFPVPINQTQVKSFLGLCSYYRRYIKNFAEIARPLHKASETNSPFKWTTEAEQAFEDLKARLLTTPILAFPTMEDPFILYTDASQLAMGAVLAQVQNGQERAICYASKAFSKSQSKYSATKRELLAMVHFTRYFRHYLLGRKFKIVTDHSALRWLHNFNDPDGLIARWIEKLAAFDYEVQHRPGKSIGHADSLSRIPTESVQLTQECRTGVPGATKMKNCNNDEEWPNAQSNYSVHLLPRDTASIPLQAVIELNEKTNIHSKDKTGDLLEHEQPQEKPLQEELVITETGIVKYREVKGDLFSSSESLAHCISADFKMSSGIARSFKRKFPAQYPEDLSKQTVPLWVQPLPGDGRFLYHLLTKERYYQKPTYTSLRASLEHMRSHAETNDVLKISMPQIGCGNDKLDWDLVRRLIREVFDGSNVCITIYLPPSISLESEGPPVETAKDNEPVHADIDVRNAQDEDEALKIVKEWVRRGRVPRNNDLQGSPELAWKLYNQFHSLYLANDVLCRRYEPVGSELPYLQQIVPRTLVEHILTNLHSSATSGHLGLAKVMEKVRQRFWWPGFKEDIKLFIKRCSECQRRSDPPKTHRHSLVEWKASYPFHHSGIDFMGPLPASNGNKVILLIGDHFTKWYEAIPLPDQQATTTATALIEHWICRFGCPYSIHSDQGRNFESKLFQTLMTSLHIDKTRTTAFRPQSNAVIERMNRTIQNMLAKCVNAEQSNWSQQLPYVMMAYRSSVHESTGYSPQFLVHGREISLPIDLMHPAPEAEKPMSPTDFVYNRKLAFQRAFELVRANINKNQKRRNAIYNEKIHGPTYEQGQKVLLHTPVVPVGQTTKFHNPWRGPYVILDCFNEVTYKIRELSTSKELIVHYDRLKPFGEKPATSNVPTRNTSLTQPTKPVHSNVPTRNNDLNTTPPETSHRCCMHFQQPPLQPMNLHSPAHLNHQTTPTPQSTSHNAQSPTQTRTPAFLSGNQHSQSFQSPGVQTMATPATPSVDNPSYRQAPASHSPLSNESRNIVENAAVQFRDMINRPYNLRASTRTQRLAEPLCNSSIPSELTDFNSPPLHSMPHSTKRSKNYTKK